MSRSLSPPLGKKFWYMETSIASLDFGHLSSRLSRISLYLEIYIRDINPSSTNAVSSPSLSFLCFHLLAPTTSLPPLLKSSLRKITIKSRRNKRYNRITKVRILQRRLRHRRQTLPSNQRFLSPHRTRQPTRMINRPNTIIINQRTSSIQSISIGRTIPIAMSGGTDGKDVIGGCGGGIREPDYYTFPIVTVAETGGGFVFGEVPGVHYAVV